MNTIWWLIQINALISVYLFYAINTAIESTRLSIASSILLGVAVLLEYLGYKLIRGARERAAKHVSQND